MNLIIGESSQLAQYFPLEYDRISSRNITQHTIKGLYYNTIYVTFAEQRTFNNKLTEKDFIDVNVDYTSKVIDSIYNRCNKIVIYGTAELWNGCNGPINVNTPIKYNYSPYIKSKERLHEVILEKRNSGLWDNLVMVHPVNFNSIQRKKGFLFYKIFKSICNKEKITVGDLDINRDIIHAKYLVQRSISANDDCVIGSGHVINIRNFIIDLYSKFDLDYFDYVTEDIANVSPHKQNIFWVDTDEKYNIILDDTVNDIKDHQNTPS